MPIQVDATLDRPVAIYLNGEVITVKVSLKNVSPKETESLAWGSVQLTCERTIGAQPALPDRPTTAIARSAANVYSSLPVVLFCDVALKKDESKVFTCEIPLPRHGLPPSFRGHLVRYTNRITVAVQHVAAPIKLVHIPVRIVPAVGLDAKVPIPDDPFLAESRPRPSVSEMVVAAVDQITAPRKANVYSMTHAGHRLTTLMLQKKTFRLGEDIIGHLDMRDAELECVQYSVSLESVERLAEDMISTDGEKAYEGRTHYQTHVQKSEVCLSMLDTSFRLAIPMQLPPTFHTDTVHLKWRLRFEFVTSTTAFSSAPLGMSRAPVDVPIETLTWHVDIYVLPCSPYNAALTDCIHSTEATMVI